MEHADYASNPMAPDGFGSGHDAAAPAAYKLSNSDFRKLMMTPRPAATGGGEAHETSGGLHDSASAPRKDPELGLDNRRRPYLGHTPQAGNRSNRGPRPANAAGRRNHHHHVHGQSHNQAQQQQLHANRDRGEPESERRSQYRDRAKERREGKLAASGQAATASGGGTAADEEAREGIAEEDEAAEALNRTADYRAVAPTADAGASHAERRRLLIQESKYLGGDMEHTHLVKGLDYVLLQKVRLEIQNKEQEAEELLDAELEKPNAARVEDGETPVAVSTAGLVFKTRLGQGIVESLFRPNFPLRNEYFQPGRMAYRVELDDDLAADSEVPTTVIRSKTDCPTLGSSAGHGAGGGGGGAITTTEIVINKLAQILSYLRAGKRQTKKAKAKNRALGGGIGQDEIIPSDTVVGDASGRIKKLPGADIDIYEGLGSNYTTRPAPANSNSGTGKGVDAANPETGGSSSNAAVRLGERDRVGAARDRDRGRDREHRDNDVRQRQGPRPSSYFERPEVEAVAEEEQARLRPGVAGVAGDIAATGVGGSSGGSAIVGMTGGAAAPGSKAAAALAATENLLRQMGHSFNPAELAGSAGIKSGAAGGDNVKEKARLERLYQNTMPTGYDECYPGFEASYDAMGDSDDETDFTKMDSGNKKGPVGRWDFETQEEYSDYMSSKEALPKAAFQYGVKMSDGRRTRRVGPKDEKAELDRQWQKIQTIMNKRKQTGGDDASEGSGATVAKAARY